MKSVLSWLFMVFGAMVLGGAIGGFLGIFSVPIAIAGRFVFAGVVTGGVLAWVLPPSLTAKWCRIASQDMGALGWQTISSAFGAFIGPATALVLSPMLGTTSDPSMVADPNSPMAGYENLKPVLLPMATYLLPALASLQIAWATLVWQSRGRWADAGALSPKETLVKPPI